MAKSPIQETHNLRFTGVLNTDGEEITMEFEDLDEETKTLKELIEKFNGETVAVTFQLKTEIE